MSRRAKSPNAGWSSSSPEPDVARAVFGAHLETVQRYADWLSGPGVTRGLIGPSEVDRLWDRHLLNCGVLAPAFQSDPSAENAGTVCDVGTGAGLPGVVLAIVRPDLHLTLVEPMLRRVRFLDELVAELELANVAVVRERAEQHGSDGYDWVTARAVAPLDKLAGMTVPLLRPGGRLLAMKGARAAEELAAAEPVLRRLGARDWSVEQYGVDLLEVPTTVVRVTAGNRVPAKKAAPGGRR